jgi:hypothetical protein
MPWSESTNRTLRCVKLLCGTGIRVFIIVIRHEDLPLETVCLSHQVVCASPVCGCVSFGTMPRPCFEIVTGETRAWAK